MCTVRILLLDFSVDRAEDCMFVYTNIYTGIFICSSFSTCMYIFMFVCVHVYTHPHTISMRSWRLTPLIPQICSGGFPYIYSVLLQHGEFRLPLSLVYLHSDPFQCMLKSFWCLFGQMPSSPHSGSDTQVSFSSHWPCKCASLLVFTLFLISSFITWWQFCL